MSAGNAGGRLSLLACNGIDSGEIFGIIVDIRCWLTLSRTMEGGGVVAHLHMRIDELMEATGRSKNQVCREMNIPRTNFNRYCRDDFQRIDANLVCKLCEYFSCEVGELIEYVKD